MPFRLLLRGVLIYGVFVFYRRYRLHPITASSHYCMPVIPWFCRLEVPQRLQESGAKVLVGLHSFLEALGVDLLPCHFHP